MVEKKAKTQDIIERLQKMGTRLIAWVDKKQTMAYMQHERMWTKATLKSWPSSQKKKAMP